MLDQWAKDTGNYVFAFRGYNVTNLGRSAELLNQPEYRETVTHWLQRASQIASDFLRRPVDLVKRVDRRVETTLEDYADSIALIVAMELAQLDLLQKFHGGAYQSARFACGFSLGEITSLVAGGVFELEEALRIPLQMSNDCIELARDMRLGVLFSRGEQLPADNVKKLLVDINRQDRGILGISAFLSPNTYLMMGSGATLDLLRDRLTEIQPKGVHLRLNEYRWPPLHTPLVWPKQIAERAGCMLLTLQGGRTAPTVPIMSLVTGEFSYNEYNARELLVRWVDHPQKLWDVVYETLVRDVDTIVHVGPEPNIIPATYKRLAANVDAQLKAQPRFRALSAAVQRQWIKAMLPKRAALLRAPFVKHIVLEDWLLEHAPSATR